MDEKLRAASLNFNFPGSYEKKSVLYFFPGNGNTQGSV